MRLRPNPDTVLQDGNGGQRSPWALIE